MQRPDSASRRRLIAVDAAVVAIFVFIVRNEHNSGSQIAGYLATVAPFLIAIAMAEHSGRSPFADHSNIGIDRLGVGRHSWHDRSKGHL